jgi:hypothetical protein
VPIVRNTVQGGSRDVVGFWVVIDFRDVRKGIVVESCIGSHVEKLYGRLAKNGGRAVCAQLQKPEENLEGSTG